MQAYRDQRSVDDPVVGATWIDGDAQRVQHIEGVVLGKHIASKKQRGRRCVVGEKAVWSRKHGAVVEVQIPLLRLGVDSRGDLVVLERHVEHGFRRRQQVEKPIDVGVELLCCFGGAKLGDNEGEEVRR